MRTRSRDSLRTNARRLAAACLAWMLATGVQAEPSKRPDGVDPPARVALQATTAKATEQVAKVTGATSVAGAEGEPFDFCGGSVAVSTDTVLLGCPFDAVGADNARGSVHVFVRGAGGWTRQAKLLASDGGADRRFGSGVASAGERVAITSVDAIYVFSRSGTTWTQTARLSTPGVSFGAVAMSGNTIIAGAPGEAAAGTNSGAAYVFVEANGAWTQQARIAAADLVAEDRFGTDVALSGDTAVVGAFFADVVHPQQGAAYVFVRAGGAWVQQAKLIAADGGNDDRFGVSVAVEANTAIVGSVLDDVTQVNQGSAYVFTRSGTTWSQQARLVAADAAQGDGFGIGVAISGETAVVGAHHTVQGAAVPAGEGYVFTRNGTVWSEQARISAGDDADGDDFGRAVVVAGDVVFVGAMMDELGSNASQGAGYVFRRTAGIWRREARLDTGDGEGGNWFGHAAAVMGDTAMVGAPLDALVAGSMPHGSVLVYERTASGWMPSAPLAPPDRSAGDDFGTAIAMSGDTAVVGAASDDETVVNQGSAYVFVRTPQGWMQQAKLVASNGATGDAFGAAVAIDGDTIVVGARWRDITVVDRGAAYVFVRTGGTWTQQAMLSAPDGAAGDLFGEAVAIDGNTAVVGASDHAVAGVFRQGAAYVYVRSGTTWSLQSKLTAADGGASDGLGESVAIDGDTVLAGAAGYDTATATNPGAVYAFVRDGAGWSQQARLMATEPLARSFFGRDVALVGDTALVGAPFADADAQAGEGSAYVFARTGRTWAQRARLLAVDRGAGHELGAAVDLSGNTFLAGAPRADGIAPYGNPDEGAAYFFRTFESTTTAIADAAPSPSLVGEPVLVTVNVTGAETPPAGGTVTVTASTGEACTDASPQAGAGNTTRYACTIAFATAGARTLDARHAGHAVHDPSVSSARSHVVAPIPTLAISDAGIVEGTGTNPVAVFTVTRSHTLGDVVVRVDTADGEAVGGADYVALQNVVLTLPGNGPATTTVAVTVAGDAIAEADERFFVRLSAPSGATLADAEGLGTIDDDDVAAAPSADLAVAIGDGRSTAKTGETLAYEVLASNAGPSAVAGARLQVPIAAGLAEASWTCTPIALASCPAPGGFGGIDATLDLGAGGSLRYVVLATVVAPSGSMVTQSVSVSAPAGVADPAGANDTASDTDAITDEVMLRDGFE